MTKAFTCSDGSGSFVIKIQVRVSPDGGSTGPWVVASGTGAYASLRGSGTGHGVATDYGINDLLFGQLH